MLASCTEVLSAHGIEDPQEGAYDTAAALWMLHDLCTCAQESELILRPETLAAMADVCARGAAMVEALAGIIEGSGREG